MSSQPPTSGSCPNRDTLAAYLRGTLAPGDLAALDSHLSECPRCALRLGELATPPVTGPTPADRPPAGAPVADSRRLGQYRLFGRIGRGGMGTVYRAWHDRLKRWVAVKVLPAGRSSDPGWVARFDREMEVVGRLDHPHIVRATDAGEAGGVHYLVMELLDGADLARVSRACGPVPVAEACEAIRQAALGLQHAHDHGLVHRDVKPHNLMLAAGGVKVLDLGLAQFRPDGIAAGGITTAGQVMGTPDYMAPEQWDDFRRVDARADVYALGCTLHHLLTGRPPFDRRGTPTTPGGLAAARPDVPPELAALVERLTARDPAERPPTADEVARLLTPFAAGADLAALLARVPPTRDDASTGGWDDQLPPAPTRSLWRAGGPRSRKWATWAGSAVVVAAAVGATVLARNGAGGGPSPPADPGQSSAPSPVPAAAAERQAGKGEWVQLLRARPAVRLWKGDFGSRLDHDAAGETLSIQTFDRALIPLGRTDAAGYRIQLGLRQSVWTGGVGVYFGGRDQPDGSFSFQMVELRRYRPEPGRQFMLARVNGTVLPGGPLARSSTHVLTGSPLPEDPGGQEYVVEVTIIPGRLFAVRWNGAACAELTTADANRGFGPDEYAGEFGVYAAGGATILTSARFMTTH